MRDSIADISRFPEDAVTSLVFPKGHNGVKGADNQLQAMFQGLVSKTFNEKLNSVKFEDHLFPKIKNATLLRRVVTQIREATL